MELVMACKCTYRDTVFRDPPRLCAECRSEEARPAPEREETGGAAAHVCVSEHEAFLRVERSYQDGRQDGAADEVAAIAQRAREWANRHESQRNAFAARVLRAFADELEEERTRPASEREAAGLREALESAERVMVTSPRDWSLDRRDAWLYALIVGWEDAAFAEVAAKHDWSMKDLERLLRMRRALLGEKGGGR